MSRRIYKMMILAMLIGHLQPVIAQEKINYTLEDIISRAKSNSPAALRAETQRENRYWQYRFFQSDYNPQLRFQGLIPGYNQSVTQVVQPDGTIEFREVEQNLVELGLGLEQNIAATGGIISVNTATNRFDNFRSLPGDFQTRYSGIPVNVRLVQPIFAFNDLKWNKKIEPLRYEESKKTYVEEMENISRIATNLFFNYLLAQVRYEIAFKNKNNTEEIFRIENGRYNIGTTTEDQLLQVELRVLEAEQNLASARLDQESSALEIRSFIGLNETVDFNLILPDDIPQFIVDVDQAIDLAFQNRADAVAFARQKIEAEAEVARARGSRFNMNLEASYGYNNAAFTFWDIFSDPNQQALVNLRLGVPILDWGRNKARMGIATANQKLVDYTIEQEIINFEQEVFVQVKNFQQLKDRIEISKKADEVADKRYEISRQRYLSGKVDITNLNIAQTEKDSNKERYIASLRDYWTAYYELRQLTLYDFESQQLLYIAEVEE
ncbi:TolC family protein [Pararhodonellum marinum]|uniref:TolC family protein n=1 Tax=Pararhodonellum marinum TaxID=2755358 RepID=UPI00188EA2E7|nr:TolC family protein [Pararhodonellum marinum]